MDRAEDKTAAEVEVELRARLFALRFAVAFILSQMVFRDARQQGVTASALVADFKKDFVGLVAEGRYPAAYKAEMMEELAAIADQLVDNARTFDSLDWPEN